MDERLLSIWAGSELGAGLVGLASVASKAMTAGGIESSIRQYTPVEAFGLAAIALYMMVGGSVRTTLFPNFPTSKTNL